jgi:UDP-galactopyranose mutase
LSHKDGERVVNTTSIYVNTINTEALIKLIDPELKIRSLVCFAHLRWKFVVQRPQHLMMRFALRYRVLCWEEPVFDDTEPTLKFEICPRSGVVVLQPALPPGPDDDQYTAMLRSLLDEYIGANPVGLVRWYYTPMMLGFSRDTPAVCTVYH